MYIYITHTHTQCVRCNGNTKYLDVTSKHLKHNSGFFLLKRVNTALIFDKFKF